MLMFLMVAAAIALFIFVAYLSARPRVRRWLGLRPPYSKTLRLLKEAVRSGSIDPMAPIESVDIEAVVGIDSLVWVEIVMRSEESGLKVITAYDLIQLLELMNAEYED